MCVLVTAAEATTVPAKGTVACVPARPWPPAPPAPPAPLTCAALPYETHGYYEGGSGWATANSGRNLTAFDHNFLPALAGAARTGTTCNGTFASEFGAVAPSSWESLSPTLNATDQGLHTPGMAQRNYAVDNFVVAASGWAWPDRFDGVTGAAAFQAQLYFGLLGQALFMKSYIETRRSYNNWGLLTWQLNEIWPTGGWGSLEYGSVGFTSGQVLGGRWKPLHYWLRRYLYRDAHISASKDARIFVRSDDAFAPLAGTATLSLLHLGNGAATLARTVPVALPRGGAATTWACAATVDAASDKCAPWAALLPAAGCAADGSDCVAMLELRDASSGALLADNFELLAPPYALALPNATVAAAVGAVAPDGASVHVALTASATALFVTLTTAAQGRFSDNAFIMAPGAAGVDFICWGPCDAVLLASSLRVEHAVSAGLAGRRGLGM